MKKLFKYGCLGSIAVFLILIFIGYLSSDDDTTTLESDTTDKVVDVSQLYNTAISNLNEDDYIKANDIVLKIKDKDTASKRLDSLRTAIKTHHNKTLKEIDKELKLLKSKMNLEHDEFKNITWVYPKGANTSYGNRVYGYFGIQDDKIFEPRFVIRYYGDDWLFWESATFLIDGKPYEYTIPKKPKRSNSGGSVWETSDAQLTSSTNAILKAMFKAKEVKYRLTGKYYKDFKLSKTRVKDIENVMKYQYFLSNESKVKDLVLN